MGFPSPRFSSHPLVLLLFLFLFLFLPGCSSLLTYGNKTVANVDPLYTPRKNSYNATNVFLHRIVIEGSVCRFDSSPFAVAPNVSLLYIRDYFGGGCAEHELPTFILDIRATGTLGLIIAPFPDYLSGEGIYLKDSVTHNPDFFVTLVPTHLVKDLLNKTEEEPVLISVSSGENTLQAFYLSPGFTAIFTIFGVVYGLIFGYLTFDVLRTGRQELSFNNFRLVLSVLGPLLCVLQMGHMFTMVAKRPGAYPELTQYFVFFSGYFVFCLCYTLMTFAWLRAISSTLHFQAHRSTKASSWIFIARAVSLTSTLATLAVWCCFLASFKFSFTILPFLHRTFYGAIACWILQAGVTLGIGAYLSSILNLKTEINQIDILKRVTVITVACTVGFLGTTAVVLTDILLDRVTLLSFWYLATLESIMLVMFISIIVSVHFNFERIFNTERGSERSSSQNGKADSSRVPEGQATLSSERGEEGGSTKEIQLGPLASPDPLD